MNRPDYYAKTRAVSLVKWIDGADPIPGEMIEIRGNQPILLDDPDSVWIVRSGRIDVFRVQLYENQPVGTNQHLFRVEVGTGLFGMYLRGRKVGLLARSGAEAQLMKVNLLSLHPQMLIDPVSALLDHWIELLSTAVLEQLPPRETLMIESGAEASLTADQFVRSRREVLWVGPLEGELRFAGRQDVLPLETGIFYPLSSQAWMQSAGESRLMALNTKAALTQKVVWKDWSRYQELMLECLAANTRYAEKAERQRLASRTEQNQEQLGEAIAELTSILNPGADTAFEGIDQKDSLLGACQLVGNVLGIKMRPYPANLQDTTHRDPLRNIATASRVRYRQVVLADDWWKADSGPLLAYLEENHRPVALLPTGSHGYELDDPTEQKRIPVNREVAGRLEGFAYSFYRPFPDETLTAWKLIQFGLQNTRRDLLTIIGMGLLTGALSTITPILVGILFDSIIPNAEHFQLLQVALVLVAVAVAGVMFQISQGLAILRLEGKMEASVQSAVFDRLINLPATFFRDYSSGDLGVRAMGISDIRQTLSRVAISSVIAFVMAIFNFGLLFVFDVRLALASVVLTLITLIVILAVGYLQIRHQRQLLDMQGKLSGMVLQFINGIAKFRVAGAEQRAFAVWARSFAAQRKLAFRLRTLGNSFTVFNAAFPVITSMVIFALLASGGVHLSVGGFLAFSFAFATFLGSALALGGAFITTLSIIPTYERAKPIFQTLPEIDETKNDPGELDGEIEVSNLSFSYQEGTPLILDNVSLHIHPGEFVALVGPSGSGKSTLFRLLLSFEKPISGSVLYSGQDLGELDIRAVRRQIGVVLQNGKVMSGDIYTNIVGSSTLTIEDAWNAARMAGFEEDIKQMPMGMQTVVSEGGGTLSGGQRQRMLIARAIVTNPRILFFDEATSALDNRTQEIVSKSLEDVDATRVVIAHRLSTIMNADRIFVLQKGHIVQSGSYQELIAQEGVFAELAKRQLA